MIRCVVFDLDGTLARVGEQTSPVAARLLHELARTGVTIAVSSGKPTFYLCGFLRQLGLPEAYLIGENGGVLQRGVGLPPPVFECRSLPQKSREALAQLRAVLDREFPGRLWYQPNLLSLTPFLYHKEDFAPLRALLHRFIRPEMHLLWYEHPDCFDIEYDRLSKGEGIDLLARHTGILPEEMASVGDWTNDYAMFEKTGFSVGVALPDPSRATVCVPDLIGALELLLKKVKEQ